MSRIATSFTSKLSSTATSPVLRIEKPDSGPWTFVYCLSQGLIKPYTNEKRMQKNLLHLPKSSCKRSPQYLPHTHGSASKRHWTPQPFLLAKQDESRSTQTELDGLKVFQQIPQFPHITGIYRSCCSLQSVFDAICSAKKKAGVRERGTFPITCMLRYICWMSSRWLQREFGNRRDCNILGLPRTFADLLNLFSVGCSLYVYPQRFHVYMD